MRLTTDVDPEYEWLKRDMFEKELRMNTQRSKNRNVLRRKKAVASPRTVAWYGAVIGFVLQLAGKQ